ncbi:MAG TPA: anti-sigma factor antagonist [Coriobacteriia bacterium]|nr:anti-sigma factor antagonist [Coriobacteriia bacterium]
MTPFEVTKDNGPRACVVRLSGDIDMSVVPDLRRALDDALQGGCSNVVLDLAEVTYADSSALGLLVWLDHRLRPDGGRLVLAGARRDVARILELSGLVSVAASIAMSDDVSTALEGLDLPPVSTDPLWDREINLAADVNKLASVREEVCSIIEPLGFPDSGLFDIKVALGEALANAIRHGSPQEGTGEVLVKIAAYGDRVILEVMDNGAGFDGRHTGSEDVYAPNGRGIMFMRALMDRVEFDRSPMGGTLVRLTKHRTVSD